MCCWRKHFFVFTVYMYPVHVRTYNMYHATGTTITGPCACTQHKCMMSVLYFKFNKKLNEKKRKWANIINKRSLAPPRTMKNNMMYITFEFDILKDQSRRSTCVPCNVGSFANETAFTVCFDCAKKVDTKKIRSKLHACRIICEQDSSISQPALFVQLVTCVHVCCTRNW